MIAPFVGIPPHFYDSPNCIAMSHATARFYGFIFWMSDRRSSLQFNVTDEEINERTNLAPRTLAHARKDLSQRGLIVCKRQQRGYDYVICDPNTRQPYPGNPEEKILYKRKRGNPVGQSAKESDDRPPIPKPAPQPISKATVHALPLRTDGRPDYGFDKLFKS